MVFQKGNTLHKRVKNRRPITKPRNIEMTCRCGCGTVFVGCRYGKGYIKGHSQRITRKQMVGDKAPGWKGGVIKKRGYIFIHSPEHPNNDGGYVKRSRLTVEKEIGRYLKTNEIVHHINGDKEDDTPSNLVVCTKAEHAIIHSKVGHMRKYLSKHK